LPALSEVARAEPAGFLGGLSLPIEEARGHLAAATRPTGLGDLPAELLTHILSFAGCYTPSSNSASRLRHVLVLGTVSKAFLEASRSPLLFDHIDALAHKRPVDHLLAAVRSKAAPEWIRLYVAPADFNTVGWVLSRCNKGRLRTLELYSVRVTPTIATRPLPLLDTADRYGLQRKPLTAASESLWNDARRNPREESFGSAPELLGRTCRVPASAAQPPKLHVMLDTYRDLEKLAPLANLTHLTLKSGSGGRNPLLDLTALGALESLKIRNLISPKNSYGYMEVISPTLREIDISEAGKGATLVRVVCPNLRKIVASRSGGGYGSNIASGPSSWDGAEFRVRDGVWARANPFYDDNYTQLEGWEFHEDCVVVSTGRWT
jgi:hypothetical protein